MTHMTRISVSVVLALMMCSMSWAQRAKPVIPQVKETFKQGVEYSETEKLLEQVVEYSKTEEYDKAIELCTEIIALDNDNARAYENRGVLYGRQEKYDLAIADLRKVIELWPNYADAYSHLGWYLIQQNKFEEAKELCQKAYELDPEDVGFTMNLGHAYLLSGDTETAREYYTKALPMVETEETFHEEVVSTFTHFIEHGWRVEACQHELAWMQQEFTLYLEADNYLSQAEELVSSMNPLKFYEATKQIEKSLTAEQALVQPRPEKLAEILIFGGLLYNLTGQSDKAHEHYDRALYHEEIEVRKFALEIVGDIEIKRLDSNYIIPILLETLKDDDPDMRRAAVEALGNIEDKSLVPVLIAALEDEHVPVREAAVWALVTIRHESVVPALIKALEDEHVRAEAISVLGIRKARSAVPALIRLVEEKKAHRYLAIHALAVEFKDRSAIPALIGALKDEDQYIRRMAAWALGKIGDSSAVPALIEIMKSEDRDFVDRGVVVEALRVIGDPSAVPVFVEALEDEDPSVRQQAVQALENVVDNSTVASLMKSLQDESERVRENAITALWLMTDPSVAPALIETLRDENADVRAKAAEALGMRGDSSAVPALIKTLRDENADVRVQAAEALGKIGDSSVVPALITALEDGIAEAAVIFQQIPDTSVVPSLIEALKAPKAHIRQEAAQALGEIGDKAAVPALITILEDENADVRYEAVEALGVIGDKTAVSDLIEVLRDKDEYVRRETAGVLGEIGNTTAIPALIEALKDKDENVRRWTAVALGKLGDTTAVSDFIELLKHKHVFFRAEAAESLGMIGDSSAVPALLEALKDADESVRKIATEALGALRDTTAAPTLLEMLKDNDESVRAEAVAALGKIGNTTAIPALIEALKDEDPELRWRTVTALGNIGDKKAVPALLDALQDEDPELRWRVVTILGDIGDQKAVPTLLETLQDEDPEVRRRAVDALGNIGDQRAVPTLLDALQDEDPELRWRAAIALGNIGDQRAVPALLDALKDGEPGVLRWKAVAALGDIGDQRAVPALLDALQDGDLEVQWRAVTALGDIGDQRAVPALLEMLKSEHPEPLRLQAGRALGDIGDKKAVPTLITALKDNNMRVRWSAAWALGIIGDTAAVPALIDALNDNTTLTGRGITAKALQRMGVQEPLISNFYKTGDVVRFHLLRKHLLFTDDLERYLSIENPFLKSATYYLLSLQAREQGHHHEQREYAEHVLEWIDPHRDTALAILSLWLKAQAELKLSKHQEALQTINNTEALLPYLSRREKRSYWELFEEQTLFFKGEVFFARGENDAAIHSYKNALQRLDAIRANKNAFNRLGRISWLIWEDEEHVEKLEAMIRTGLGIAYKELSKTNLEQAVKIGEAYQSENSLEMENEEKRYLELAKLKAAEGEYEEAQGLIEELHLRRQQYLNRRMDLQLSDPEKQEVIDEYDHKQRQIEDINRELAEIRQGKRSEEKLKELEAQRSRAKRDLKVYVNKLKRKHPDLAALLGAKPVELAAVQEQLPEDTALLQYLVLADTLTVFVITAYSVDIIEIPVGKADLQAKVEQFRSALFSLEIPLNPPLEKGEAGQGDLSLEKGEAEQGGSSLQKGEAERGLTVSGGKPKTSRKQSPHVSLHAISQELYQLLIHPIVNTGDLDGITQLGISPNNVLHYLPFEALYDGQDYLLDTYQVFYINSTSMLWVALDRTQQIDSEVSCLLAFANPDGTLHYADSEVDHIAQLFAHKTVYHQHEATKRLVQTADEQGCVLHFATHGVFRPDSTQSYLIMADGHLTVEEIWGLPLTGIPLATLSACQTGLGERLTGDEVVSLENAFIFAGSPTVIATLWSVDDQGTAELMKQFYEHLLAGKTKAEALRTAKQELKQQDKYHHPYYWAAFTLRGGWY